MYYLCVSRLFGEKECFFLSFRRSVHSSLHPDVIHTLLATQVSRKARVYPCYGRAMTKETKKTPPQTPPVPRPGADEQRAAFPAGCFHNRARGVLPSPAQPGHGAAPARPTAAPRRRPQARSCPRGGALRSRTVRAAGAAGGGEAPAPCGTGGSRGAPLFLPGAVG